MKTSSTELRYEYLIKLIVDAGQYARKKFEKFTQLEVKKKKGSHNFVSLADQKTEQLIKNSITEKFPTDSFLGEEYGYSDKESKFLWVIDPIDGTGCFLSGLPYWCVSIALFQHDELVAGAIYDPNLRELFHANRGSGARLNHNPILPRKSISIKNSFFALGYGQTEKQRYLKIMNALIQQNGNPLRNGSAALMGAYTAAYRTCGFYETHLNSWDISAAIIIAQESGCYVSDFFKNDGLQKGNPILICPSFLEEEIKTFIEID